MPQSTYTWQFPSNESNEVEGPNDPGIRHFTKARLQSVIRESIQNSLDAQADSKQPVIVDIDLVNLSTHHLSAGSLEQSLVVAAGSPHNDEPHRVSFKKAARLVRAAAQRGTVCALRVRDRNTTGATDTRRSASGPSKWESLTRSTGYSAKDSPDAAGSYGLGKHAAYALTDLRAVLYATAWSEGDQLRQRFQGRVILVSHELNGASKRKTGYLGAAQFNPLADEDVPDYFRRDAPGLDVYIPGFEPNSAWSKDAIKSAITNFFYAIIHGGLQANIDGCVVDSSSIDRLSDQVDIETRALIDASRTEPLSETTIPDIGRVVLHLTKASRTNARYNLALVRDAGMLISTSPRAMGIPGLQRIPGHWENFTAIIACFSDGEPSVLRDSESPSHDSISVDHIVDGERRKRASEALWELGNWCREQIRLHVEPDSSSATANAVIVAPHLPIRDPDGSYRVPEDNRHDIEITDPRQSDRAPSGRRTSGGRVTRGSTRGGDDPPNPPENGQGTRKRREAGSRTRLTPTAFAKLRFLPGGRRPSHSLKAMFDSPKEKLSSVQLMVIGEDGSAAPAGLREAYIGSRKLRVKHDKISSIPPSSNGRIAIEIITREPIDNKTYYLTTGGD